MSQTQGFVDLRIGHGANGIGDDSVWPSFTDIMTVIVMIFLMALVVIMARNVNLDRELSSTITEKEAATLENQDLANRILQLQKSNTLLEQQKESARVQINTLVESEQALSLQIETLREQFSTLKLESGEQIASLTGDNQSLSEKLDTVSAQFAEIKQYLLQSQLALQQTQSEKETLAQTVLELRILNQEVEQKYSIANEEVLALTELIKRRKAENAALQAQASTSVRQFKSLQDEYQTLDAKFRDLIRPARSAAGKQVARVWIEKTDAGVQYTIKQPDQLERKIVEPQQLHKILQVLKEKFGEAFFVSVIIPENSGLPYGQAANLMDDIHQKYDYYFQ